MKKRLLWILPVLCAALLLALPALADEVDVTFDLTYEYGLARTAYQLTNEFRTGDNAWYWNSDDPADTTKTDLVGKLSELSYVKESCLVKGFSKDGKPIIRMYVSYNDNVGDRDVYKKEMMELIEKKFSKFSLPKEIIEVKKLPETPLMKVDFMKLTQNSPEEPVFIPTDEEKKSLLPVEI